MVASLKDTTPVGNHLLSCVILSHIVTAGLCHQQDFVEMMVCDFLNGREGKLKWMFAETANRSVVTDSLRPYGL